MINLTVEPSPGDDALFPGRECSVLASVVNMVTPDMLQNAFGTTDPGELTFGQIWSLPKTPGLENVARVIMDDTQCRITAKTTGARSGVPSRRRVNTLFSGYYADQCTALGMHNPGDPPDQSTGILGPVNLAASIRGIQGNGSTPIPVDVDNCPRSVGCTCSKSQGPRSYGMLYPIHRCKCYDDQLKVFTGAQASLTNLWYESDVDGKGPPECRLRGLRRRGLALDPDRQHERGSHPARPPGAHRSHQRPRSGQRGVLRPRGPGDRADHVLPGGRLRRQPFTSATGTSSPITVTGLTNGQQYQFRMTATNAAGTSEVTAWSNPVTLGGSPPTMDDGPAHTGFVGKSYLSSFAVSGDARFRGSRRCRARIPPGLTLGQDGTLAGTPTQAGEYKFGVRATNRFGSHGGVAHGRDLCDRGTAPRNELAAHARQDLHQGREGQAGVRQPVAVRPLPTARGSRRRQPRARPGDLRHRPRHRRKTGDRNLTLRHRCGLPSKRQCEQPPAGHYTLVLSRKHRSTFVPVTVH